MLYYERGEHESMDAYGGQKGSQNPGAGVTVDYMLPAVAAGNQ